jgi:hypothetical protein
LRVEQDATEGPATSMVERETESVCSYEGGNVVRRSRDKSTPICSGVSSYEPLEDSTSSLRSDGRLG